MQDSTHIAGSVLTLGAQRGPLGASLSGFHGREPDENRWNIDTGRVDSWAARVTFDPAPNWSAQISTGHLQHPEAAESGNIQRTTASIAYSAGGWHTSVILGHNDKTRGRSTNAYVAESVVQFGRNYLTARAEIVDKDEIAIPSRIRALTAGYSRDLWSAASLSGAVGANVTVYAFPRSLDLIYGGRPHSFCAFVRVRGAG